MHFARRHGLLQNASDLTYCLYGLAHFLLVVPLVCLGGVDVPEASLNSLGDCKGGAIAEPSSPKAHSGHCMPCLEHEARWHRRWRRGRACCCGAHSICRAGALRASRCSNRHQSCGHQHAHREHTSALAVDALVLKTRSTSVFPTMDRTAREAASIVEDLRRGRGAHLVDALTGISAMPCDERSDDLRLAIMQQG
jgi:hypothetical protein